jgi:flagellar hook-associated protein 1 FlgK
MSRRALDTNQQGIQLTGHNLANISNPAYARQRLKIQTGNTLPSPNGPQGTGSVVSEIEQVRNALLDSQIVSEGSVSGYLAAQQKALEFGEVNLGQRLDRQSSTPEGATAAQGVGGQFGVVEGLSEFFGALQALSANPNSTADRQVVLLKAENLTEKFNSVNARLAQLRTDLNTSIDDDIGVANSLLTQIANLSTSVTSSELAGVGNANDLRDRRQQALEALGKIVNFQTSTDTTLNSFSLTVGGVTLIDSNNQVEDLETYTDALGGNQVRSNNRTSGATTDLTLTSGSVQGTIDARDGAIATLNTEIDTLAGTLITQVNSLHSAGVALDGATTGAALFTGTGSADIQLNTTIRADPSLIQASSSGDAGDNGVALALATLNNTPQTDLGDLTFIESYNQSVANLGQALNNATSQALDQEAVNQMLTRQRDSVSGVSIDEEMTNLVIFQRAFQASAKMISTVDELLQSVIALSR